MDSIFNRRSIRKFNGKEVECEKIERILRAGMQAPSAHNFQPWEFIVVEDQEKMEAISKMSPHALPASKGKVSIVVLGNMKKVQKDNLWWVQDLSAATQNMLLQIVEEGLGGIWLGFYPEPERCQKLKEYFQLPEHIVPFSVVTFGYTEEENRFIDRFQNEKISFDRYEEE
ncbi:MAG: nitroreductase family protein [Fusobacteriaceae bacterium]